MKRGELIAALLRAHPARGTARGYLDGGATPELVAGLFEACELLQAVSPWKMTGADRVLRVDIPALDVGGACVAVIGGSGGGGRRRGEPRGVVLFPSLAELEEVERAATRDWTDEHGRPDFGVRYLGLTLGRRQELPAPALREWAVHRWPVARATAHPWLERRERDGAERPLTQLDLRVVTACAASLGAFFAKHGGDLDDEEREPLCESYFDADDLEVRFTYPYEAFVQFEIPFRPLARAVTSVPDVGVPASSGTWEGRVGQVGRNDLCPCGSGRKYKRCCFAADRERSAAEAGNVAPGDRAAVHARDERLVLELAKYGGRRFGREAGGFVEVFADAEASIQLAMPWSVYGFPVRGRPVVDWYLDEHLDESGKLLPAPDRAWLEAQQASWLSVWEVVGVEPGAGLELVDLLSGERRRVHEISASRSLVARDAILARVVDDAAVSVLCGVHQRPLPPAEADEVVRRARRGLRRRGKVPVAELRAGRGGRDLIELWEGVVEELDRRQRIPPNLANTDGEPFLLTTDQFAIAPGAKAEVEELLALLPGVERHEPDGEPPEFTFTRPGNRLHSSWENTILGRAWIARRVLHVESNSRARADRLRAIVESACGERLRHRGRRHVDPLSEKVATERSGRVLPEPPAELAPLVLELKRRHYADWADQPLPALAGRTPRQAVRTPAGRKEVDLLLKEMENHEQRSGDATPFDFASLRRNLALGE